MDRREFLSYSSFSLASLLLPKFSFAASSKNKTFRFGMVTDIHYADTENRGTRMFRQSIDKVKECVQVMNEQEVEFLVELGDLKDQDAVPNPENSLRYLDSIETELQKCKSGVHHVLGNHDLDSVSKDDFLDHIQNDGFYDAFPHYSFTKKGFHFVVLDATFRKDGTSYDNGNFEWHDTSIPAEQIKWLKKDLARNSKPTIVFIHYPLNSPAFDEKRICPANADEIRSILEDSGSVMAVFSGHHHTGSYSLINDIHYYTLKSVIDGDGLENSNYAIVEIDLERGIEITGFRQTENQLLEF